MTIVGLILLQLHEWTHKAIDFSPNLSKLGFASDCMQALLICYLCIWPPDLKSRLIGKESAGMMGNIRAGGKEGDRG